MSQKPKRFFEATPPSEIPANVPGPLGPLVGNRGNEMEAKKVVKTGFIAVAAGAGAYMLFSKRYGPTRKDWADFLREKMKPAKPAAKPA